MVNIDSISQELDRLYQFEISEYISRCDELKRSGYKIYRNDSGQHKVVLNGPQSQNRQEEYVYDNRGRVRAKNKKENIFVRGKKKVVGAVETVRSAARIIKAISNLQKDQYSSNQNPRRRR